MYAVVDGCGDSSEGGIWDTPVGLFCFVMLSGLLTHSVYHHYNIDVRSCLDVYNELGQSCGIMYVKWSLEFEIISISILWEYVDYF